MEALPHQLKADGRIHGSFNQVATVTGRFASREPNLQNLPPRARRLIVAPKGWLLLGIDFSQIEPRILAHMSGDPHFREPYLKGEDLYSTLAARVFKVPLAECGDGSKHRKMMKIGLLAVMYGTSMFTLSEQLGISVDEAHRFIEGFYEEYPDVYAFIKDIALTTQIFKNDRHLAFQDFGHLSGHFSLYDIAKSSTALNRPWRTTAAITRAAF